MAAPEYLQQAVVSAGKRRSGQSAAHRFRPGVLYRTSIPSLIWAGVDFCTAVVCGIVALRFRMADIPATPELYGAMLRTAFQANFFWYITWFAACVVFFSRWHGLYAPIQSRSGLHEQRMILEVVLLAGLLLCGLLYLTHHGEVISRLAVLLTVVLTGCALSIRRFIWRKMVYARFRQGVETRNILIIGSGRVGHALRNHLQSLHHFGFRFKGFIALSEKEMQTGGAELVAHVRDLLPTARSLFVDEVFFSVPADRSLVMNVVEEARSAGIDVRVVPDLYDGLAWNAPIEYIGQFPTIPLHRREFPIASFLMKRTLDLTVASLALLILSPILLLIAFLIRFDSPGPIFYRANRIGRKGRKFNCFKFRTMVVNADELKEKLAHMNEREGILFKIKKDPRITRVGRVLRKYSLDELPQFWNVLRGDMSLVGPRPPLAAEVEKYDLHHLRRLDVLPGMTGLWQVEARQDPSFDSYISLDTAYVENWTFTLDIKILIRTVSVVLGGTGT